MQRSTAQEIVDRLKLDKLPGEGGYLRRVFHNDRMDGTLYLITAEEFSSLHLLTCMEVYHFYMGDPALMIQIDSKGTLTEHVLGNDLAQNHHLSVVVPSNVWQGTKLLRKGSWALFGTNATPAFDMTMVTLGNRKSLLSQFPQHQSWITNYTYE